MVYFERLLDLLKTEREADRKSYQTLAETTSVAQRRANGLSWYPVAIRGTEMGRGDYLIVEVERTTHQELPHQLRFGVSAMLFSNHDAKHNNIEGTISWLSGNRLKLSLRTDELPEWAGDGKLGIDLLFDDNSYEEMQQALKTAAKTENNLVKILTGEKAPTFQTDLPHFHAPGLNPSQQSAVNRILAANELAIVHGPPARGRPPRWCRPSRH